MRLRRLFATASAAAMLVLSGMDRASAANTTFVSYTPSGPQTAANTDSQLTSAGLTDVTAGSYTITSGNVLAPNSTSGAIGIIEDQRAGSQTIPSQNVATLSWTGGSPTFFEYVRMQSTSPSNSNGTWYYITQSASTLTLGAQVNGSGTSLASTAFSPATGTTYVYTLTATGSSPTALSIGVTSGGNTVASLSVNDSTAALQTAGWMGYQWVAPNGTIGFTQITQRNYVPTPPLTLTSTTSAGASTAANSATASGGTAPYTYTLYASPVSALATSPPSGSLVYTSPSQSGAASFTSNLSGAAPQYLRWSVTDNAGNFALSPQTVAQANPPIALCDIGDSITAGSVATNVGTNDWASLLPFAIASVAGPVNVASSTNRGIGGTVTADWLPSNTSTNDFANAMSACATAAGSTTPLYVELMLDTNDTKTAIRTPVATHTSNLATIIAGIKSYSGIKLAGIFLSDAPYIVPGAFGQFDEQSDALLVQYRAGNATLVDNRYVFAGDLQSFGLFADNPSLFGDAGVHPNNTGHQALAYQRARAFANVLGVVSGAVSTATPVQPPHPFIRRY